MCDTLVALPGATARCATLFAKNSDRERNEAQFLELTPAGRHSAGAWLQLTYIAIPQAPATHACLLSRPFWMWGAEMGVNAHGVVIGNEAVHSVIPAQRRRALIGMDLVRLGLERAASAAEAVDVITDLLERHGQGGDCGHLGRFYYHNSFLIADRDEAYVLETVGRWWALEQVTGTRAISNVLGVHAPDRISSDLSAHATAQGWRDGDGCFDFAETLMDRERDKVSRGAERCRRGSSLLAAKAPALRAADIRAILRDHGEAARADPAWTPAAVVGRTICMHAGPGDRRSQTTAAMVSELGAGGDLHWVTGAAAPCLSIFKPVVLRAGLPDQGPRPGDRYDPASPWWRRERLHRAVLADYAGRAVLFAAERDALEASFAERMDQALAGGDPTALRDAVDTCWQEAGAAEARWLAMVDSGPKRARADDAYARSWRRLGQVAGAPPPI